MRGVPFDSAQGTPLEIIESIGVGFDLLRLCSAQAAHPLVQRNF
jgi:hypothetical protein